MYITCSCSNFKILNRYKFGKVPPSLVVWYTGNEKGPLPAELKALTDTAYL